MALESLTLTPPSGPSIPLNGSAPTPAAPYWALEELDLGNPARREELVGSTDASGALPARVSPRDVREVTATVRLLGAADMDAALNAIGALEAVLESAERLAAAGPTNPVTDLVRLVYSPAGATASFSLIVLSAEITGVPRTLSGDEAGWFISRPVVTIRALCDPFAYGAQTTYLDATTSGAVYGSSVTVPGGVGEVSPWLRLSVKDVASPSRLRGRVVAGVKVGEANTNPVILASALTPVAGTVSSGIMSSNSGASAWIVAGALPRQTRTGTFKVYLLEARSVSGSVTARARFSWSEAGGSKRSGSGVELSFAGPQDAYLGEVSAGAAWDGWIETAGSVAHTGVLLVPADSVIDVSAASASQQLSGAIQVSDGLATTSAALDGRTLESVLSGSTTWSQTSSGTWSVSASTYARRSAQGTTTPIIALAGSANYMELDLQFVSRLLNTGSESLGSTSTPFSGGVARYSSTSNFLVAGWTYDGAGAHKDARPGLWKVVAGAYTPLWQGDVIVNAMLYGFAEFAWRLQVTEDGRWWLSLARSDYDGGPVTYSVTASGQDAALISGGALGGATTRVGLFDRYTRSTPVIWRDLGKFRVSSLIGVTPPPVPAGGTLTLHGSKLLTSDGAEYPYLGSSGLQLRPGVDNNLTVFARRSAGLQALGSAFTDALDLDIVGYPRFLSVPHS